MKRSFSNSSVRVTTVLLLIGIIFIPLSVIFTVQTNLSNRKYEESETQRLQQSLGNSALSINVTLTHLEQTADKFAQSKEVLALVSGKSENVLKCRELAQSLLRQNDPVAKIVLFADDKVLWQGTGGVNSGYSLDTNELTNDCEILQSSGAGWKPVRTFHVLESGEFRLNTRLFAYVMPVGDSLTGVVRGIIIIYVPESEIRDVYQYNTAENSITWLMDMDHNIYSASDEAAFNTSIPDIPLISKGKVFSNIKHNDSKGKVMVASCNIDGISLVTFIPSKGIDQKWVREFTLLLSSVVIAAIIFLGVFQKLIIDPLTGLIDWIRGSDNQILEAMPDQDQSSRNEIVILLNEASNLITEKQDLAQKVFLEQIKVKEAEQQALLSEIQPHFLYNTLDSIKWTAFANHDRDTAFQLEALATFLSESLNFGSKTNTIGQEVTIIRSYCYLIEKRFGKSIDITIGVQPELEQITIPKLILQPLVENSFRHGLQNKDGNRDIIVKAKRIKRNSRSFLVFYVADNGEGCDAKHVMQAVTQEYDKNPDDCFALKNIYSRLKMTYGGVYFRLWSSSRGTMVKIMVPLIPSL